MARQKVTRRFALKAAAIGAAAPALLRQAAAQAPRKVSLTLSWVAEGASAYPYVAKAKGYWSEVGLDVTVVRGYGSVAATQAVGAGRFDFGLSANPTPILQAAKGLPIVQIACCGYDSTMGINVLADSPIRVPKDLEGRQLAVTPTSGDYPFIPVFARKAGLDLDKVKMVQVDGNVRSRLLTERKVDAIDGYAVSNLPIFTATGVETRFMLFSSYGMNFYGVGLITQQSRAKSDPKLCTAMAVGLLKGLRDCMTDLDGALKLFLDQVPEIAVSETARKQSRIGMGIFNVSMVSDIPKKHGFGYTPIPEYDTMIDLTMANVADKGDTRPKAADIATNDFIGDVRMDDAAWQKSESSLAEFARYVR
jgi:ABC-type nitrate/sulfonate/bicarbonate transport system substrate-binding protein